MGPGSLSRRSRRTLGGAKIRSKNPEHSFKIRVLTVFAQIGSAFSRCHRNLRRWPFSGCNMYSKEFVIDSRVEYSVARHKSNSVHEVVVGFSIAKTNMQRLGALLISTPPSTSGLGPLTHRPAETDNRADRLDKCFRISGAFGSHSDEMFGRSAPAAPAAQEVRGS